MLSRSSRSMSIYGRKLILVTLRKLRYAQAIPLMQKTTTIEMTSANPKGDSHCSGEQQLITAFIVQIQDKIYIKSFHNCLLSQHTKKLYCCFLVHLFNLLTSHYKMNLQKTFQHSNLKTDYTVTLTIDGELRINLVEKFGLTEWEGVFSPEAVMEITTKTGHNLAFEDFWSLLLRAFQQKDVNCYIDVLSSQDLQNLKNKSSSANTTKQTSKSNKRYAILTYMTNDQKYHFPLSLNAVSKEYPVAQLKQIYGQLRVQLQSARAAALNDTAKTDNSFSINYQSKKNSKNQSKLKEIDQFKSQNEILKAKLTRLEQQVQKKKANIEIQAAIERTKLLKENIETANLELVDWKNNVTDQQQKQNSLKKELAHLHKKICGLLTSQKQVLARKKGQEIEKELNQVRNNTKKNNAEIQKLKKELQLSKANVKELELKAKKLNSEKEVLRKGGRKGPYSSAGSVRSYNSFNSSKKSYNSGVSASSKGRSNYSYNSHKLR